MLHGVRVVEVGVLLKGQQNGGVEKDGECQVAIEREEGETLMHGFQS